MRNFLCLRITLFILHRCIFPAFHCSKDISDIEKCWEYKGRCEHYNFVFKCGGYSAFCGYAFLHLFLLDFSFSSLYIYLLGFFFISYTSCPKKFNIYLNLLFKIRQVPYTKSHIFLCNISDKKYSLIFLQGGKYIS